MTIEKAIAEANALSSNLIDGTLKIEWLSRLDGRIFYEVLNTTAKKGDFCGYDQSTPADTELLIPYPWDSIYVAYLEMETARVSSENVKHANARILFNELYNGFVKWYTRTHVSDNTDTNIRIPVRRY